MKIRMISFLLVLVMVFSCLSLNIFAADVKDAPEGEPSQVKNTRAVQHSEGAS